MTDLILFPLLTSVSLTAIGIAWFYQRKLKQSRDSLTFALQSGRMGTWDINLEDDSVSCSQEMLNLWGFTGKQFNGQRSILQTKVHPEDLPIMIDAINAAIQRDHIYELEYRIIPIPGVIRWVLSRGQCTFDLNSRKPVRFSGVVYDITEKKVKEEEYAAAMRMRDQFFMIAGHELRTPLTCMHLQFQASEWDLKNTPEVFTPERIAYGLKKQQRHLDRITRIVENILDESKITEGRFYIQCEGCDLAAMVTSVLEEFRIIAKASEVDVHYQGPEKIEGKWDRFRLEQVLLNLLINAIRYGNKKPIEVEVKQDDTHAFIIVRDQGVGIPKEDHIRIFERFERVHSDKDVRGFGLGLYISKNIVHSHGGEIRLRSEVGVGSEFTVMLPLSST